MYRSTKNVVKQRVLIASNHKRFRYELSRLVQVLDPGIEVVGEAATSFDALVCSGELRPDLVLLDLSLRPGNGLDLVTHIHRLSPVTAVVVISNQPDADYREAAIEAGALDYVNVLELTTMLPAALEAVNGRINSPENRQTTEPILLEVTPPLPPAPGNAVRSRPP
jgi:DNA-binding NarL/FixJ family response regulator